MNRQVGRLSQRMRLLLLAVSLVFLGLTSWAVRGEIVPGFGSDTLWFYSAALTLLLSDLVLEPWYTRPADALANGAAVLLASLAATDSGLQISGHAFSLGRAICIGASGAIVILAVTAMISLRPAGATQSRLHKSSYVIAATFGRARVIFSLFFAATAAAAFAEEAGNLLLVYVFGGLFLWTTPLQVAFERLLSAIAYTANEAIAQPRTAYLVGQGASGRPGQDVLRGNDVIGIVVDVSESDELQQLEVALQEGVVLRPGATLALGAADAADDRVVGSIGKGTSLDRVVIRGGSSGLDKSGLREGGLIEAAVRDETVLFQVVDAEVEGASPEGTSRSKRVRVVARKLGQWDDGDGNFVHADWIPEAGSPARMAEVSRTKEVDPALIGRIPGTDYGTRYDPTTGATHNTAILGILGVGKTTLAAELTWRTLDAGARVVVIDITNEYAHFFQELFGPAEQAAFEEQINEEIRSRVTSYDYEGDSAGNQTLFRRKLREWLDEFFAGDQRLLIVNPSRLVVTKDDGGFPSPGGEAKRLVSLNPAEVTAIVAREILNQVSKEITDELKVCLVLEEAHSLAPEWNSTANDGEKQAATATARALMQGRKFGFGSIVVTQRTATVTKSILNQCNTVFALRVYDQTGTEFLGNFIGADYARLLANLPDRTAIVFGKASSCRSPLLIELNDASLLADWRKEIASRCGAD